MTCKVHLRSPLLCLEMAQPFYLLGCDTARLLKLAVALMHPRILSHNPPFSSNLPPYI
jgi:hypothetical protein